MEQESESHSRYNNSGQKTILIVEDEAIIALHEQIMLEKSGFHVLTAHKPEQAHAILAENRIDLVLMDIDLGRDQIDGTELARQILAKQSMPIIFCTSHSEKEMVEKVKGITRYGYVLKNGGEFVLKEAVTMGFELYEAHCRTMESEIKYRGIVQNSIDGFLLMNNDGRFVDTNDSYCAMSGYSREEVISMYVFDIDVYEKKEDILSRISKLSEKNNTRFIRFHRRKDGTAMKVEITTTYIPTDDNTSAIFIRYLGDD